MQKRMGLSMCVSRDALGDALECLRRVR
jgi:hypothetical protein